MIDLVACIYIKPKTGNDHGWYSTKSQMMMVKATPFDRSLVCVWVNWMTGLTDGGSHFRMRITLGVVLIRSLVFHAWVPECSRNGSGVRPYLWVQMKFVWFRQSTQNAGLCPAELLGQFFSDSVFNLLRNLCDIFLVDSRNGRVSWLAVPRIFLLCFACNGCIFSFPSQRCHLLKGKCYTAMKTELVFIC